MDVDYKLATIKNDERIIEQITKYENELSQEIGQDVILIAYTRDKR